MNRLYFLLTGLAYLIMTSPAYPKIIMVVLGSANLEVLNSRIEVAYRFYKTENVDKIIVSGGCGAHGSSICEASLMYEGLKRNGVNPAKIYKEENAKTTVQNYVFSRELKDENGEKIIQKGDTVYVVSDHWHAISVAARFQKYDDVVGRFFIEGSIEPRETDKLDYVSIFNGQINQAEFIRKAKWLTPDAVWVENNHHYYLMDTTVYIVNTNQSVINTVPATTIFKELLFTNDVKNSFIEAQNQWWIRQGDKIYVVDKKSKKIQQTKIWSKWIKNMPANWNKADFNTGVLLSNKLILFANEKILVAERKGNDFSFVQEMEGSQLIDQWPYSWGKSNISALHYDQVKEELRLFRNREVLNVSTKLQALGSPQKFNVKWKE